MVLRCGCGQRFFALVRFLAAVFRAVVRFLAAGLRAVAFFRVDFRAAGFLAVDFFAELFRVDFRVDFRAAGFLADALFAELLRAVDFFRVVDLFFIAGDMGHLLPLQSGRHTLQASPFPFAHPAPHAVPLVAAERIVQAFDPNGTVSADPLRLP
jgi:hypothetical protein